MSEMESVLLIRNSVYKVFLMLLLSILKERLFSLDIQLPENLKRISTTSSLVRNLLGQELLQQEAELKDLYYDLRSSVNAKSSLLDVDLGWSNGWLHKNVLNVLEQNHI